MATFGIESNGRLEKTALYYNGEQIGGVKEIFLNLDEDGTFDSIIQYEGKDKQHYTKNIFRDYLTNIKVSEPSFTEEEAAELQLLEIESDGDIENTMVFLNEENLEGIVNVLIHIKSTQEPNSLHKFFAGKKYVPDHIEFKAEITFRNEDDSLETEEVFR
jgi:hypothetical protein